MATESSQTPDPTPPRSWNWVSNKTFSATPFYKRSWQILKQDWLVFIWKLVADMAIRFSTIAVAMVVFSLFVVDFQFFVADGNSPLAWVDRSIQIIQSPRFLAGFLGTLFFISLLGTALQALVTGGIWGVLDCGLRGEPVKMWSTFWRQALDRFPRVLSLFLLRFAIRSVTVLLTISLVLGFVHATASGTLSQASGVTQTLLIAGSMTFLLAWIGLTRLALEAIAAPLIIDDVDLGEAILRGCVFVVDNFWSIYRILLFSLGVLLVPLGIYWVLIMFNNLALIWPALAPVGMIARLGGEIFLWISVSAIGVFFYGALFAFYRLDDRYYEQQGDEYLDLPTEESEEIDRGIFGRDTTFENILPEESPNRFSVDDVLPDDDESDQDQHSSEDPED